MGFTDSVSRLARKRTVAGKTSPCHADAGSCLPWLWIPHPPCSDSLSCISCRLQASFWSIGTDTAPGSVSSVSPPPFPSGTQPPSSPAPLEPRAIAASLPCSPGADRRCLPAGTVTAPQGKGVHSRENCLLGFLLLLIL